MATGGEGNESQIQLGYGSCIWGTGRVTACPPGPGGVTQRSSVAGQYRTRMNFIRVEGMMRKMSLNRHQYLDNGFMMKTRRRW